MWTVTNNILAMLVVCGAIVLSQYDTDQQDDESSPHYDEVQRQLALITHNQRKLMNKLDQQDDYIEQLQDGADGLLAHWNCRFPACTWCTCLCI